MSLQSERRQKHEAQTNPWAVRVLVGCVAEWASVLSQATANGLCTRASKLSAHPLRDGTREFGCVCGENPPAAKPTGQEKLARDKFASGFLHPHPHLLGFGRVLGAH